MEQASLDHEKTARTAQRPGRRWQIVVILIASVTVGAFVSWQGTDGALPPIRVSLASVATTDSQTTYLLADPIWSQMRGHGEGSLSNDAKGIRLGATIALFEIRRRRSDPSLSAGAQDVARLLETFPNGANAAAGYRKLSIPVRDAELQSAVRLAEQTGGLPAVRLGAWLQGARFAAAVRDETYFDDPSLKAVSRAAIAIDERAETEAAARQFDQVSRKRPRDWTSIGTACEDLLRLLGTRSAGGRVR